MIARRGKPSLCPNDRSIVKGFPVSPAFHQSGRFRIRTALVGKKKLTAGLKKSDAVILKNRFCMKIKQVMGLPVTGMAGASRYPMFSFNSRRNRDTYTLRVTGTNSIHFPLLSAVTAHYLVQWAIFCPGEGNLLKNCMFTLYHSQRFCQYATRCISVCYDI